MPAKKASSYRGTASEHGADFKVDVDEAQIKAEHHAKHLAQELYPNCLSDEDEIEVVVTSSTSKQKPFPRLYVIIDRKDNAPVGGTPHLRERDAYEEKKAFAEAGITVDVVPYEPLVGGRR